MARSTFYYHLKALEKPDRYEGEKKRICEIFHESKGRYGYRRVTMQLHNEGITINHKSVEMTSGIHGESVCALDEMQIEADGSLITVKLRNGDEWSEITYAMRSAGD